MATASVAQSTYLTTLPALIAHNMTATELEALAEEIMQDELCSEADAYEAAICEFPRLYLTADRWDINALFAGNADAGDIPF